MKLKVNYATSIKKDDARENNDPKPRAVPLNLVRWLNLGGRKWEMGAPNQLRRATLSAPGTVKMAHVLAGCIKGLQMMHTDGEMLIDGAIQLLNLVRWLNWAPLTSSPAP